jgi:hypothetical protein
MDPRADNYAAFVSFEDFRFAAVLKKTRLIKEVILASKSLLGADG